MNIHTTRNSVCAATVFAILSGVSTLGSATLPNMDAEWARAGYNELNLTNHQDQEAPYQRPLRADTDACDTSLTG